MKTKQQIIKSRPVFLNDWAEEKSFMVFMYFEDVFITFDEFKKKSAPYANVAYWQEKVQSAKQALKKHKEDKILFASYTYEGYEGSAWVLFTNQGKLYEVNGSHCSCNGLEGQWEPEEVNLVELRNRVLVGTLGQDYDKCSIFRDELIKFLGLK